MSLTTANVLVVIIVTILIHLVNCKPNVPASEYRFKPSYNPFSNAMRPSMPSSFSEYRPTNVINSLVSPMLPRTECTTSADNRQGICIHKKACLTSGGISAGNCGLGKTCCIYQGSCRSVINANESYFVSPNYPSSQIDRMDPPICIFTLERNQIGIGPKLWPVCQIKVQFDEFNLAPPFNGTCGGVTDTFVISGASSFNATGLPETGLCGDLSGQHLYINVDPMDTTKPLLFVINAANDRTFNRKWSIRIIQIPCKSPSKAPPGCLQYFTSPNGVIESFNYRGLTRSNPMNNFNVFAGNQFVGGGGGNQFDNNQGSGGNFGGSGFGTIGGGSSQFGGSPYQNNFQLQQQQYPSPKYQNGLNYGVCIAQSSNTCGIKFEATDFDFGGNRPGVSGVGSAVQGSNYGCTIHSGTTGTASAGDLGDYLLIPGASKDGVNNLEHVFCGQKLNPVADQSSNVPIISFFKPFVVYVKSDSQAFNSLNGAQNQKGFQIQYSTIPCI